MDEDWSDEAPVPNKLDVPFLVPVSPDEEVWPDLPGDQPGGLTQPNVHAERWRRAREHARALIALLLTGALAFVSSYTALAALEGWADADTIELVAASVISPLIGVGGSVAGFYFGRRSR